ncbi:MAG: GNAT family N-acetyltransferase [Pseudomonadota bacterium]
MPAPTAPRVRRADWLLDEAAIAALRREVFIDEQGVPEALEWEVRDPHCRWFVAEMDGMLVGISRLLPEGRIGRMAVRRAYRRRGVGSALLQAALAAARAAGLAEVELSAQTHAVPFYARHGFRAEGPEYPDAGIPHRTMKLHLKESI